MIKNYTVHVWVCLFRYVHSQVKCMVILLLPRVLALIIAWAFIALHRMAFTLALGMAMTLA